MRRDDHQRGKKNNLVTGREENGEVSRSRPQGSRGATSTELKKAGSSSEGKDEKQI